jgi:hypothetical protein
MKTDLCQQSHLFMGILLTLEFSSEQHWHPYSSGCRSEGSTWKKKWNKTQRTLCFGPWSWQVAAGTWMLKSQRSQPPACESCKCWRVWTCLWWREGRGSGNDKNVRLRMVKVGGKISNVPKHRTSNSLT